MSNIIKYDTQNRAKKAVILVRVSSKEQEEGYSIDAQTHRLNVYCEHQSLSVLKRFTITESSTQGDRRKFMDMIKFIKSQKEPIALVADKVDRVQRSFKEYPLLDDLVQKGKIELHFRTENYVIHKDSVSQERLMWSMSVIMAQSYVDSLRDNVKRGIEQKIRQGEWTGKAPIGYLNVRDERGKGWIEFDPERSLLIRRIFQEYSTGAYTIGEIVKKTRSWGLKNKDGNQGNMSKSHIHKILNNPFYYGEMIIKGQRYKHVYEPIIDKALFSKCQEVLDNWHRKPFQKGRIEFTFRGLIKCATTGRVVSSERHKKTNSKGKTSEWVYLSCAKPDNPDKKMWIREEKIEEQIEAALSRLAIPSDMIEKIKAYIMETDYVERDFIRRQLKELHREQQSLIKKIDNIIELVTDGVISKDDYTRKRAQLNEAMNDVQQRIKAHTDGNGAFKDRVVDLLELASSTVKAFRGSNSERKRLLINLVFSNLHLKGNKLLFSFNKPFDLMLDLSKKDEWCALVDALRTIEMSENDCEQLFEILLKQNHGDDV